MYTNKHATRLAQQTLQAGQMVNDINRWKSDLEWFSTFDIEEANSKLGHAKRAVQVVSNRLAEHKNKIESSQQRLTELKEIAGGFFSGFWRSAEQTVAHRQCPELDSLLKSLRQSAADDQVMLDAYEKDVCKLTESLLRYRRLNSLEAQATIASKSAELTRLQDTIEETHRASEHWESMAGEVLRKWKGALSELDKVERDIAQAEGFERELSSAMTSREKAMIHQRCEARFQNGRPGAVLSGLNGEQRKLQRDADKLQSRLKDIIRLLDKQIKTLIIDGNNLCYEPMEQGKGRFIGLAALKALVPHLCRNYKVTLMFDPGIRQRLSLDDFALKKMFPDANVIVMPPEIKADEGLLAAAEFDTGAYVISNDHFADYPEQPAVQENRVLKHIVHPRSVQIHQLQLNIPY